MNSNRRIPPWYIIAAVALILLIAVFHDTLIRYHLLLPAVILLLLLAFGLLLYLGIRMWKKSDSEILNEFDLVHITAPTGVPRSLPRFILSILVLIASFIVMRRSSTLTPVTLDIMFAIVLVLNAVTMLLPRLKKSRNSPGKKPVIPGSAILAFFIGLAGSLFLCFFIGIGVYHGVWWFTLPPGLIFLVMSTRPLTAAIRTVIRSCRNPDDLPLRQETEPEPWDKPDFDPRRYRRK